MIERTLTSLLFVFILATAKAQDAAEMAKSDSLFAVGVELYNAKNYKAAIPCFEECKKIDHAIMDSADVRRDYAVVWLASCHYKLGDTEKAISLDPIYYKYPPIDRRLTVEIDKYTQLFIECQAVGDLDKAATYAKLCADEVKRIFGTDNLWYVNSLQMWADCLFYQGKLPQSKHLYKESSDIYRKHEFAADEGYNYLKIAQILYQQGLPDECAEYLTQAYNINKEAAPNTDLLAETLLQLTEYNNVLGNFQKAAEYANEASSMQENWNGQTDFDYYLALLYSAQSISYRFLEKWDLCFDCASKSIQLFDKFQEYSDYTYYYALLNRLYSAIYLNHSNTKEFAREAKNKFETSNFKNSYEHACVLQLYCRVNPDSLSKKEIINISEDISEIFAFTQGENSHSYFESLLAIINVADPGDKKEFELLRDLMLKARSAYDPGAETCYQCRTNLFIFLSNFTVFVDNNLEQAEKNLLEAKRLLEEEGYNRSEEYIKVLYSLGNLYNIFAQNDKSLEVNKQCIHLCEQLNIKTHSYIYALSNIINHYNSTGDIYNYNKYSDKLIEAYDAAPYKSEMVGLQIAMSYFLRKDFDKASKYLDNIYAKIEGDENFHFEQTAGLTLRIMLDAVSQNFTDLDKKVQANIDRIAPIFGKNSYWVAMMESLQAAYKMHNREFSEAASISNNILKNAESYKEINLQAYAQVLSTQLNILREAGEWEETYQTINKLSETLKEIVAKNFKTMTYQERSMFWNQYAVWYNATLPNFLYSKNDDRLLELSYNAFLLSKGLLLNSEIEIKKIIAQSGNQQAIALYEQIQKERRELDEKIKEGDIPDNYDTLNAALQEKERNLIKMSKAYGDYTKHLEITWKDVRDHLKKDEIAIEFVAVPINSDRTEYMALVLKQGYNKPHKIELCSGSDIKDIENDSLYANTELYQLVWALLEEELKNISTIYFSPSGTFYNIALESTKTPNSLIMGEKYKMYRLSSTKEIVTNHSASKNTKAYLYGGMDYASYSKEKTSPQKEHKKYASEAKNRAILDDFLITGEAAPLEGTKDEVYNIGKVFKDRALPYHIYDKTNATEETLKELSESDVKFLHIATHGFYWSEQQYNDFGEDLMPTFIIPLSQHLNIPVEDKLLTRSGLLFAGANNALGKKDIPED